MKMDLLYVRSLFRPADFGGNRYPWEVTRRLAARGHRVRVITPRPSGPPPGRTEAVMRCYPVSRRTPLETFLTNALLSHVVVEREVARSAPDLVVLSSYETAWGHFVLPGRSRRVPAAFIYHSGFRSDAVLRAASKSGVIGVLARPLVGFVERVERIALEHPELVIAVSPFSQGEVLERTGRSDGVEVIPTGVDVDLFFPPSSEQKATARAALGLGTTDRVLVTVGRLASVKRYELAIDALAELRRTDERYRLLIVGDGPQREVLEARARTSGLAGAVRFEGFRDGEDLRTRLWAADAELCTSEFENWSLAVLEALAGGLPVFAVARGGLVDMLSSIQPKWLLSNESVGGIARDVHAHLNDPELPDLAREAARRVAARFSWESVVAQLESAFQRTRPSNTASSASL